MSAVGNLVSGIFGGGKKKDEAPAPAPVPVAASAAELAPAADQNVPSRTDDILTRSQSTGTRAAGASITQSDNEADLLGYSTPKKKRAARSILG